MIHSNIPKRPTVLAAVGLAAALVLGIALNPTPAFAKGKPCKSCDPGGGAIAYRAKLQGRVFHFVEQDVIPNGKGNALLPDPDTLQQLVFTRPGNDDLDADDVWNEVFAACENFFGPNPIGKQIGAPSGFTVPAGNWGIDKFSPIVQWYDIPFDSDGLPLEYDSNGNIIGGDDKLYFEIVLTLFGDNSFGPKDPWLPDADDVEYNEIKSWITGGTAKGVRPRFGCVTDGSADHTEFAVQFESTLVIRATSPQP